jgi:septal ring factor EnvC (AmiA/AmiB activator)
MDVLEWTRKACKQLEQELDRTTAARDTLKAELTEVLGELAAATAELAAARDELRARDEAIADSDQRARWRLAQTPYIGIGEGIAERLAEALSPNLTDWTLSHEAREELERTIDEDRDQ